jgi:hypothetical protein
VIVALAHFDLPLGAKALSACPWQKTCRRRDERAADADSARIARNTQLILNQATIRSISGVYAGEWEDDQGLERIRGEVAQFAEEEGRWPRLMVVKMGQDGHDRGAEVIATVAHSFRSPRRRAPCTGHACFVDNGRSQVSPSVASEHT